MFDEIREQINPETLVLIDKLIEEGYLTVIETYIDKFNYLVVRYKSPFYTLRTRFFIAYGYLGGIETWIENQEIHKEELVADLDF